jgi:hypothetical protein
MLLIFIRVKQTFLLSSFDLILNLAINKQKKNVNEQKTSENERTEKERTNRKRANKEMKEQKNEKTIETNERDY